MIHNPWEWEDKSNPVSHILSPFPFLSASHNQLSWLQHAHSCPDCWSPHMMKRGADESRLCVCFRSTVLCAEERRLTDIYFIYSSPTFWFRTDVKQNKTRKSFISTVRGWRVYSQVSEQSNPSIQSKESAALSLYGLDF